MNVLDIIHLVIAGCITYFTYGVYITKRTSEWAYWMAVALGAIPFLFPSSPSFSGIVQGLIFLELVYVRLIKIQYEPNERVEEDLKQKHILHV